MLTLLIGIALCLFIVLHIGHMLAIRHHSDLIRRLDDKLAEHLELDDRYERSEPGDAPESTQSA